MRKLFTLTLALLASFSMWAALPLTALPTGTNDLSSADGHLTTWATTTKNQVIYDDNNYIMLWSNGNNLVYDSKGLGIGNSKKKSAFVFYVSDVSDISVTIWYNGSDADVSLRYMGTTTSELTDPNNDDTGGGTECDKKSITSADTQDSPATLSTSSGAAGYYKVFGTLRFGAKSITVTTSSNYTITYNANGGSGEMSPTTNTVAACTFTAPSGKAFGGWKDSEDHSYAVGSTVEADVTLYAQWVDVYSVTYKANNGTAEADSVANNPATIATNTFFTAPAGKEFKEWNTQADGKGTSYAPGNPISSTVTLYAKWIGKPTTIFHWRADNSTTIDETNGTTTGGSVTLRTTDSGKSWATESATYNAAVPADMKSTTSKELKSGGNALYLELSLTTGSFQEGDTIYVTGYKPWSFTTTTENISTSSAVFDVADSIATGSGNSDVNMGYQVIGSGIDVSTIYARRRNGTSSAIAAIKVIRPAAREIASTVITLSDVKVNDVSISSDSLATLVSDHSLLLKDSYAAAPEIKFNEHTVITYADGNEPETKVTDKVYTVTATVNGAGKWEAAQEINSVTYTVTAVKLNSAKVYYYDGATKLGEEVVALNDNPVDYADYQTKSLYSFAGWYNNSDLAEEHKIADISALTVTKDTTVYGKWTPLYASSVNIEQIVLDEGTSYDLMSYMGTLNYASNITNSLDSLNDLEKKDNRNYAYLGLKVKAAGKLLNFRLGDGIAVKVKFGAYKTGSEPQVSINGSDYAAMTITDGVYSHTADGDELVSIKTATTDAVIFKQIMIGEDLKAITLPDPSAYLVTIDKNIEDGTVTANWPNKKYRTPIGETVTLTVTPADGYKIASVTLDGEPLTPVESVYSFTMPSKDVTVSATFSVTTALDNTADEIKAVKFIENGQLFIRRGEKVYTITGEEVK